MSHLQLQALPWPDLVILDRDGVINHDSTEYIKSREEWVPIEGSLEAIARLSMADIKVGIATNQRGITLGLYDHDALEQMHAKMHSLLKTLGGTIDAVEFCVADNEADPFRKPNPGMLLKICEDLELEDDAVVYFIGDKSSDITAGRRANLMPVLVRTGNGAKTEQKLADPSLLTFDNLAAFVDALFANNKEK